MTANYLSPHFTLDEFTLSQTAERQGIDNMPPGHIIDKMRRTAQGLEAVRMRLGGCPIVISSGYRCPTLNAVVGGSATSQHMTGEAVDFTAPRFGSPREIADALVDAGVEYDQLILEFDRWVHISFVQHGARRQALIIDRAGTRPLRA